MSFVSPPISIRFLDKSEANAISAKETVDWQSSSQTILEFDYGVKTYGLGVYGVGDGDLVSTAGKRDPWFGRDQIHFGEPAPTDWSTDLLTVTFMSDGALSWQAKAETQEESKAFFWGVGRWGVGLWGKGEGRTVSATVIRPWLSKTPIPFTTTVTTRFMERS